MDDDLRALRRALEAEPADDATRAALVRALRRAGSASPIDDLLVTCYEAGARCAPSALEALAAAPGAVVLERGTAQGRESIARALHAARAGDKRFTVLSAARHLEPTLEEQLFGEHHDPRQPPRPGLLEQAGRTVFVDELEDASTIAERLLDAARDGFTRREREDMDRPLAVWLVLGLRAELELGGRIHARVAEGLSRCSSIALGPP